MENDAHSSYSFQQDQLFTSNLLNGIYNGLPSAHFYKSPQRLLFTFYLLLTVYRALNETVE